MSRRSFLTSAAAIAPAGLLAGTALSSGSNGNPVLPATVVRVDPIFALIDAHQIAHRAHAAALEAVPYDEAAGYDACYAEWDAWEDLRECVPTTLAGTAAFAVHAFRHAERVASADDHALALEVVARNFVALVPSLAHLMPTNEERPSLHLVDAA